MNSGYTEEIETHLTTCDSCFHPPLSVRTSISTYAQKITNNAQRFEAWSDHKLIGLVAAYYDRTGNGHAFITNLSVLPNYQHRGIAHNLLKQSIQYLFQHKISIIKLEVEKENKNAISLYKKFKFSPEDKTKNPMIMVLKIK